MADLFDNPSFARSVAGRLLREKPLGFVDIGARGGAHPMVEDLARGTAVLGFEPDPQECERLRSEASSLPFARIEFEPVALSDRSGAAELHHLTVATNDSLLAPNAGYVQRYDMLKWRERGRSSIETTTLDGVLFDTRRDQPSWGEVIKLDTQGTEYEVMSGAARTLRERTVAVMTEVSFCPLYVGQKLFSEVELLLRGHGFAFYGFDLFRNRSCGELDKRVYGGRERAIQADAVFFKDTLGGDLAAGVALSERASAVLFATTLVLGYHDFALELARRCFDGVEREALESVVRDRAAVPVDREVAAVEQLAKQIAAAPKDALLSVTRFVDQRRRWNDVMDVPPADGHADPGRRP